MTTSRRQPLRILLRRPAIERRVRELAREISADFRGQHVHLVAVLKGAFVFLSDLVREMEAETSLDFISVSSYGTGRETSGRVRLLKDLDSSIEGLNVVLVEDIVDTGMTAHYLKNILKPRNPRALKLATLLDKPSRRIVKGVKPDYVGFKIPNEFVVGYGMDYGERYRGLRNICILRFPTD